MLALTFAVTGQQTIVVATPAHGDIRASKDGLVLPKGEFTVGELIEATASYLCRNYLYDFAEIERAGTFQLQRSLAVDALGSEELLYALLSTRDLAVLPIDELRGVYGIFSLKAPSGRPTPSLPSPWRSPEEILRRPMLREIAYTHVILENADARNVANMLRQATTTGPWRPGRLLASATDRHFLMLHGYRDQIVGAIRLVQSVDATARRRPNNTLLDRIADLERRLAELERR